MGGHGHDHGVSAGRAHRGRLVVVLCLTSTVLVAEVIGAIVTGSLALLADAGHMLTDVAGITLALLAVTLSGRKPTPTRTFGLQRLEVLAALTNALLLFAVGVYILIEAWQRWSQPPEIRSGLMLAFAAVGLVANVISLFILRKGSRESINVRGAYLEVLGDLLGSVAVIVAALVIATTGWQRADIVASVAVAAMVVPRAWSLAREAIDILIEATPRGVDLGDVRGHLLDAPGVIDVHDLHAWTITSGLPVLSAHLVVSDEVLSDQGGAKVLDHVAACLADHFDIAHSTFQLEPTSHAAHEHPTHD